MLFIYSGRAPGPASDSCYHCHCCRRWPACCLRNWTAFKQHIFVQQSLAIGNIAWFLVTNGTSMKPGLISAPLSPGRPGPGFRLYQLLVPGIKSRWWFTRMPVYFHLFLYTTCDLMDVLTDGVNTSYRHSSRSNTHSHYNGNVICRLRSSASV